MSKTDEFDFKTTFLNLTRYTVPHEYEFTLKKYLPEGVTEDQHGNFYISIGESTTLFTSHLDTASLTCEKVNHIIEGDIISTDGSSILGGDNKAGVTILLYMISKRVPGTYFFFAGEELGLLGSKAALEEDAIRFYQFKRAVSFDGVEQGVLSAGREGEAFCSDEFANALAFQFCLQGVNYKPEIISKDIFTDSLLFTGLIPECTNLSSGVWNLHTPQEYVNIRLVEEIARAAAKVNWEGLPAFRLPKQVTYMAA